MKENTRTLAMSLHLTYPITNKPEALSVGHVHGKYATLRLTDEASGMVVAEIDLGPAELLQLMSSSEARVNVQLTAHPERIGMEMEHDQIKLGYVSEAAAAEAELNYRATGEWDYVATRSRQGGIWVEMRRWRKPATPEPVVAAEPCSDHRAKFGTYPNCITCGEPVEPA